MRTTGTEIAEAPIFQVKNSFCGINRNRLGVASMSTTTISTTTTVAETTNLQTKPQVLEPAPSSSIMDDLWTIPEFEDKYAERQWAKEHMAAGFRVFAKLGYNDGAGGHISLRDPVDPACFWISKSK